jgi:PAS domain S-box-containing protein
MDRLRLRSPRSANSKLRAAIKTLATAGCLGFSGLVFTSIFAAARASPVDYIELHWYSVVLIAFGSGIGALAAIGWPLLRQHSTRLRSELRLSKQELASEINRRSALTSALQERESYLAAVLANLSDSVVTIDENGTVETVNAATERIFGYSADEMIGRSVTLLMPEHKRAQYQDFIDSRLKKGLGKFVPGGVQEIEGRTKDGRIVPINLGISEMVVEGERKFIGVMRDISRRKRAEEEARAASEIFKLSFENMMHGAIVYDENQRVIAFNRRYFELVGIPPEEVFIGQTLANILRVQHRMGLHPDKPDIEDFIRRRYEEIRRGGEVRREIVLPDDRFLAVRSVSVPGKILVITLANITERNRAARALRESETRIRAIVENAADAIVTVAADGTVLSLNPAGERIFGYPADEIVGQNVDVLVPRGIPKRTGGADTHIALEAKGRRKDGTTVPLEVSAARASLAQSEIGVLILRDVTPQKEMQAQLLHTSKLATVGQMAAGLAHEMNQPLNVIRMAADNVLIRVERGQADPEWLQEKLELIGQQAAKVGTMILHMRVFARSEAADLKMFDPLESVRSAVRLMDHQLRLANIRLHDELPNRCALVLGHPSQLEQVIINLLTNAHDAIVEHPTASGDGIGSIELSLADDQDRHLVAIRVRDTGGGIPDEIRERVFDPFFTTKDVGKGTGLGLSICNTIVTEMKGRIDIVAVPRGTEITVTLPAQEVAYERA